jgi:hypothetical protein
VKRIVFMVTVALVMAAMMVAMAMPAFAQGQVERGPEHANSICSFSGLNDEPDDPVEGGRVQSYGQIVQQDGIEPSEIKSGPPSPGTFCNAHLFPYPEGFEGEE